MAYIKDIGRRALADMRSAPVYFGAGMNYTLLTGKSLLRLGLGEMVEEVRYRPSGGSGRYTRGIKLRITDKGRDVWERRAWEVKE